MRRGHRSDANPGTWEGRMACNTDPGHDASNLSSRILAAGNAHRAGAGRALDDCAPGGLRRQRTVRSLEPAAGDGPGAGDLHRRPAQLRALRGRAAGQQQRPERHQLRRPRRPLRAAFPAHRQRRSRLHAAPAERRERELRGLRQRRPPDGRRQLGSDHAGNGPGLRRDRALPGGPEGHALGEPRVPLQPGGGRNRDDSPPPMTRSRHGFTLIEVLLSVAILAFVVAGISQVLIKQSQASSVQAGQRDLEESGRLALIEMGRAIRMAGYGIDPTVAFDFGRFACTTPGTLSTCNGGGRDRTDAPDELVVAWRDPNFARKVALKTGGGPYTITLDSALTARIDAGRIVELLCDGAENAAYVAVTSTKNAGDTDLVVRLLTAADGYFTIVDPSDACYSTATVLLVERARYYVANDTDGVPALWRDRGRGGAELLFRGIEDLQLSYDIGQPPAGSRFAAGGANAVAPPGCINTSADGGGTSTWTFGSCAGLAGAPDPTITPPNWRLDAYDAATRYTGHPANIRNVNVVVVARATRASPDGSGDELPALLNRPARIRDNFRRAVQTLSEQPQNLLSRANILPPVFPGSTNVGGG